MAFEEDHPLAFPSASLTKPPLFVAPAPTGPGSLPLSHKSVTAPCTLDLSEHRIHRLTALFYNVKYSAGLSRDSQCLRSYQTVHYSINDYTT